ncbi:chemotaxis protein CheA [Caldisalinibacter kiritimatiensis]|uniref:Chemotaxis protein CheA n=1 Tax=Caldisalinibacter kiritimatiensis TaxID=1304284 RepID=R1AQ57_9FIRM|nr:chemotaxis protein CheA [Caldisalinibacter kiritimatiensis]EOC99262.1 Signal transduction histidine kinase CheA [Caldisalinibacter kiritimatiensis]
MVDDYLLQTFIEETEEHLQTIEEGLLELEKYPDDKELIGNIFRAMHSIKGGAGMVGLSKVNEIAHGLENILEEIRQNSKQLSENVVSILLQGIDIIRHIIETKDFEGTNIQSRIDKINNEINNYNGDQQSNNEGNNEKYKHHKETNQFKITLNLNQNIFETGTDPLMLLMELSDIGDIIEVSLDKSKLPNIYELDIYTFYLKWTVILETDKNKEDIENIFIFILDDNDIKIEEIKDKLKTKNKVKSTIKSEFNEKHNNYKKETVRVDTKKLENILNDIAELLISQSNVKRIIGQIITKNHSLKEEIDNSFQSIDKIVRRVQEQVMSASMIPIGGTFTRLHRIVRDITKNSEKKVNLEINGKDTELDRKIIEELADPLNHLIRNAVDHGIEAPKQRRELGKAPEGKITLDAYHQQGNIIIEITDDGRGIDKEKVLNKAREKGLIEVNQELNEQEIYSLIFRPGFSTKQEVSDISGRGVGLDVVKTNINNIRGNIEILSKKNEGTKFKIKLPLTLAIIDGIVLRVANEEFVLPVTSVVEFIDARSQRLEHVEGKATIVNLRNEYIPCTSLQELLDMKGNSKNLNEGILVIIQENQKKLALQVDEIIGQEQVVIKNINENMGYAEGFAGATILGNGEVSLILDVSSLFKLAHRD